jgi:hypothetical protein
VHPSCVTPFTMIDVPLGKISKFWWVHRAPGALSQICQ